MQRVVEIEKFEDEIKSELSLKPTTWDEYVGQEKIKKNLQVFIEASKKRTEALDHMLFFGPPGLGKTTIANIISIEMDANIKEINWLEQQHIDELNLGLPWVVKAG